MTEPYSTDFPGWQQALADRETGGTVVLCAKCSTRPESHGTCSPCSRAVWKATDLGRLFTKYHENPDAPPLVTYAAVSPDGELTTVKWYFCAGTDCNGDPSGYFSPSVTRGGRSRSFGSQCFDPFYCTEMELERLP